MVALDVKENKKARKGIGMLGKVCNFSQGDQGSFLCGLVQEEGKRERKARGKVMRAHLLSLRGREEVFGVELSK